jgi:hypothetical protein
MEIPLVLHQHQGLNVDRGAKTAIAFRLEKVFINTSETLIGHLLLRAYEVESS